MSDAFMDKFNALGERIKVGGAGLGRKMTAGMSSVGGRMKEIFQVPTAADRQVEEATAETLVDGPDWEKSMQICDTVNVDPAYGVEIVRAMKKRLAANTRNSRVQMLTLSLLETCVKNCEKMFSEVASERVLDEIVKAIDDPLTSQAVRHKALTLIESWGEATDELRYLPVFEETYKSLKSRGVQFPGRDAESLAPIFTPPRVIPPEFGQTEFGQTEFGQTEFGQTGTVTHPAPITAQYTPEQAKEIFDVARNSKDLLSTVLTSSPEQEVLKDEVTATLVEQCRHSQTSVQRFIERGGENEQLLFEALNINDELQQVLSKFEQMRTTPTVVASKPSEPALIPVGVVDEEETFVGSSESSLVRKTSAKPSTLNSMKGDDAAMADLDEMIFGKGGAPSLENGQGTRKNKNDSLIDL